MAFCGWCEAEEKVAGCESIFQKKLLETQAIVGDIAPHCSLWTMGSSCHSLSLARVLLTDYLRSTTRAVPPLVESMER